MSTGGEALRCKTCGSTQRRAYWSNAKRERVLARCIDCGANPHGAGFWLPLDFAIRGARGPSLEVDPHLTCSHGHGPCSPSTIADPRQGSLI